VYATTITTGEVTTEVFVYGDDNGEPIILQAPAGAECFEDLGNRLAEIGFRAVAIQTRGAGRSTGPLEGLNLHDLARDIANVIEAMELGPCHVLGYDSGNRMVRTLAADRPDLVRTVLLLACGGKFPPLPQVMEAYAKAQAGDKDALAVLLRAHSAPSTDVAALPKRPHWPDAVAVCMSAVPRTPAEEFWTAGGVVPILAVQGLDDWMAPPENGRALKEECGDRVTLVEIAEAGHNMVSEKPEEIARAVLDFLAVHRSSQLA
jgi:pimeloyl-ACP methyl ester carboxylesterase